MDIVAEKLCNRCTQMKPLSEFEKQERGLYGRRSQCKACRNARLRERYATEPGRREKVTARVKQIYATDEHYREQTRARVAAWQATHKEQANTNARRRYAAYHGAKDRARRSTPEYQARKLEWERQRLSKPEARERLRHQLRQYKYRRRAWLENAGHFTLREWREVCQRYDHRCVCCGEQFPLEKLTADHVVPLSRGGNNTIANIQPLCRSCNTRKNARTIDYRPNVPTSCEQLSLEWEN